MEIPDSKTEQEKLKHLHSLLRRQMKRHVGGSVPISAEYHELINAVNTAYKQFEQDRLMLERSLDLSSQELLQANSDLCAVINSSVDGILAFARDYRYTIWNPGMEHITGIRRDEVLGRYVFEVAPFSKETGDDRFLTEALAGKTIVVSEHPYVISETGRRGFFGGHFSPLCNESGQVIGGLAIIRDITEHKQVQDALKKRERQQKVASEIGELCLKINHLNEVMNRSVALIAETLGVEFCKILLLNDAADSLTLVSGVGWKNGLVGAATVPAYRESQAGYTLLVNEPVIVEDLRKETRFNGPPLLHSHEVISGLSVPMVSRGQAIGVMGVHSKKHYKFTAEDAEFLQGVSNLIAVTIERKRAEEKERNLRNLLASLSHVQSLFIADTSPRSLFEELLKDLLTMTQSEYGFIGEILYNPKGEPYLKTHAITNIAWNEETRAFYEKNAPKGLEFYNLNTLFGEVMTSGKPVLANNPATDPRRGGLPQGHPALHKFLGLPFYKGKKLMGMVGIANRPGGYDEKLVEYLQPLLSTCANIIDAYRNDQRRKEAEESLAEQAIRDALTNIYNRRYFYHRVNEEIARVDRNGEVIAILLCDLDHFKTVNDTRGHHVGDEALKSVAQEIERATRGTDLVFRWGGDEIVDVLSATNREGVLIAADRIRKGVNKAGQQMGLELDISIGAVLYPEHGRTVDGLIRMADRALYIAKKSGGKIHIGEEEYHLDEHTVKVVFQPVVNVELSEVMGYEALSRDGQGRLSILELFKKYNAIGQLNELKCLCFRSQLKVAKRVGLKRVFINVDFSVLTHIDSLPKPMEMDVILEISELEALHDVENQLRIAEKWRRDGYKFALDDFGAGFISLPFVAKLVPEYIKLDRSTVLQAVRSDKFRRFSRDLVEALRNYSTEGIIAEGIETEKELNVVKEMGVTIVQGFLLGRPQELKEVI